jgi:5-oxoprolinase (ATP-hydrolysing)
MSVEEAALGALQIQKYGMTQAIELNSVRRGYDPREFTLVAAGGAGPLFACDIALELEIARVLVPPHPGIIAATGLLATDLQHEFVATERHSSGYRRRARARFDDLVRAQLGSRNALRDRQLIAASPTAAMPGRVRVRTEVPGGTVAAWVRAELPRRSRRYSHRSTLIGSSFVPSRSAASMAPVAQLEAGDRDPARAERSSARWSSTSTARHHLTPFYERELLRVATASSARRSWSGTTRPP